MKGNQISHYLILEKLGDGGMGAVYKAQDLRLLRYVAIKLLRPELMIEGNKRLRFIKEAQTASSLNHPNICTIHDINEENDQHFIVMELVDGKTLREIIDERNVIPELELVNIAVKICEALSAVHAKGISHRDIKPENIMITKSGLVKVMDFGLAKLATEYMESVAEMEGNQSWRKEYIDSVVLTNFSGLLGTVHYMSPEQAKGEAIDQRSDIFSLGIMLFELATGQKPFKGETNLDILTKIISDTSALDFRSSHVSPEFEAIIDKALKKEALNRYQSVSELLADLKQISNNALAPYTANTAKKIFTKSTLIYSSLVVFLIAAGLIFTLSKPKSANKLPQSQTVRLTSFPGVELNPSLSPDGKQVAFSWNGPKQDNFDIYTRTVEGGTPIRLTTSPLMDYKPVWSSDGLYLAFVQEQEADSNKTMIIYSIPSVGGKPQKIISYNRGGSKAPEICWDNNNQFIYFHMSIPDKLGTAIYKVSLQTKAIVQVTSTTEVIVGDIFPRVSPNGKYLGFIRKFLGGKFDIFIKNLETNELKRVTNENVRISGFTWGKDNETILFSATLDGSSAIWKTNLTDKKPEKVLSGLGISEPHYSPATNRLVYRESGVSSNLWKLDLQNPDDEKLLISSSQSLNMNPNISPDGKKILFSSNRLGTFNIWMCKSDGTEQKQVSFFDDKGRQGLGKWSPLNNEILINFDGLEAFIADTSGGKPLSEGVIGVKPAWSQDGQGFYASVFPDIVLYYFSRDGKIKKQLTTGTALGPLQFGEYIYYKKFWNSPEIWRVAIDGSNEQLVFKGLSFIDSWAVTKNGIYFINEKESTPWLKFYNFGTMQVKEIKALDETYGGPIDVDQDEKYLLYTKYAASWSDIILVENLIIN